MSDIVERLRKAADTHFEGINSQWCRENREAADEIERLRDEIKNMTLCRYNDLANAVFTETERCIAVMLEVAAKSKWHPDEVEKAIRGEDET